MYLLTEDKKSELISKSKQGDNYAIQNQYYGKNRYERRIKSKLASSVKHFNAIDMNKFFKDDILDVNIDVKGETDIYLVRLSFSGTLDELHNFMSTRNKDIVDRKVIAQALARAFNRADVYINCTCPDFIYRHKYWSTKHGTLIGEPEVRPADITNPKDSKGPACKHIILAMKDTSWLIRVASVVYNYINYMKDHRERDYQRYIYPAIYQEPYPDDVQLDIYDVVEPDEEEKIDVDEYQGLVNQDMKQYGRITDTTLDLIDDAGYTLERTNHGYIVRRDDENVRSSNKYAREKTRFKPGNEYRFKKQPRNDGEQTQIDFDALEQELA